MNPEQEFDSKYSLSKDVVNSMGAINRMDLFLRMGDHIAVPSNTVHAVPNKPRRRIDDIEFLDIDSDVADLDDLVEQIDMILDEEQEQETILSDISYEYSCESDPNSYCNDIMCNVKARMKRFEGMKTFGPNDSLSEDTVLQHKYIESVLEKRSIMRRVGRNILLLSGQGHQDQNNPSCDSSSITSSDSSISTATLESADVPVGCPVKSFGPKISSDNINIVHQEDLLLEYMKKNETRSIWSKFW